MTDFDEYKFKEHLKGKVLVDKEDLEYLLETSRTDGDWGGNHYYRLDEIKERYGK